MASDNFNRADALNLGANWTNQLGSIDIISNQAKTTAQAAELAYYTAENFSADQYSQIVAAGVGANGFCGTILRASDILVLNISGNNYLLAWALSGASQGIYKYVNGVASLLQSLSGALSVNDVIKFSVTGTTIRAFKNGAQLGTDQSDSAHSSGAPGIYNSQNASLQVLMDDWEGGDLVTTKRFFLIPN